MSFAHRVMVGLLSLLVAALSTGTVAAQTPVATPNDPCASFVPGTPASGDSLAPVLLAAVPTIEPEDAVLGTLEIRQQHAVTALEAIIVHGDDPEVIDFATSVLPEAQAQLDMLESHVSEELAAYAVAMVAVLDQLRQEQDLPADQGGLAAYLPGYVMERVCPAGIDRDAVALQTLLSNDRAIVEIASLGELTIDDDEARELVMDVSAAASDRLTWFEDRSEPEATPAATPAP